MRFVKYSAVLLGLLMVSYGSAGADQGLPAFPADLNIAAQKSDAPAASPVDLKFLKTRNFPCICQVCILFLWSVR